KQLTAGLPVLEGSRDPVTEARDGKSVEVGYRIEASVLAMVVKLMDEVLGMLVDRCAVETASPMFCEQLESRLDVDHEQLRVASERDFATARLPYQQGRRISPQPQSLLLSQGTSDPIPPDHTTGTVAPAPLRSPTSAARHSIQPASRPVEEAQASTSWNSDPVRAFERFRNRVCDALHIVIEIHRQAMAATEGGS